MADQLLKRLMTVSLDFPLTDGCSGRDADETAHSPGPQRVLGTSFLSRLRLSLDEYRRLCLETMQLGQTFRFGDSAESHAPTLKKTHKKFRL